MESDKMSLKSKFILLLTFVIFVTTLLSTLTSSIWSLELWVSALPYILLLQILLFIFVLLSLGTYKVKKKKVVITLLSLLLLFVYPAYVFIDQSFLPPTNIFYKDQRTSNLKVYFHNKYYLNSSYAEILSQIKKYNPDVVAFSEANRYDFAELTKELPEYVYTRRVEVQNIEDILVFSKKELKEVELKREKHSPVVKLYIDLNGEKVSLYISHMLAPVRPEYVGLKQEGLNRLMNLIKEDGNKKIVFGDFNTTLYSPQIKEFVNSNDIYPVSKGKGIFSTWDISFLKFHIDHAFVSKSMKVEKYEVLEKAGSDHNAIFVEVSF